MTKELLQQALDALIESRDDVDLCYAGVKAARLSFRQERQLGFYEAQLVKHDAAIEALKQALAQQEQPASVDAYNGAREDVAIWKKRALEAEELNRKFIAEVNGPTYLGEPVKQEQPAQEPVGFTSEESIRALKADAKRFMTLAEYLVSYRTECDDALIDARTVEQLRAAIDAMKGKS
jgi:tetratricopeptide (TPR) repeat protein